MMIANPINQTSIAETQPTTNNRVRADQSSKSIPAKRLMKPVRMFAKPVRPKDGLDVGKGMQPGPNGER
jgi:hypothetical protein